MPTYYPSTTTTENSTQITLTTGAVAKIIGSAADPQLIIHNNSESSYDPAIAFKVGSTTPTTKFTLGVDDSDSDKLKIGTTAVDASTRLTIDSSGNIGIGTATPASLLHLKSNGAGFYDGIKIESQSYADRYMLIGSGLAQGISGTNDLYLKCGDSNGVIFQRGTTDTQVLVLSSNSNIGVGTNSPSSKLDVAGDIEVGSTNAFYFGAPTATVGSWRVVRNAGNDLLFQRCASTGPDVWTTKSTIAG